MHGEPLDAPALHWPPLQEAPGAHGPLLLQAVTQVGLPRLPVGTGRHWPGTGGRLQASQGPPRTESQQTPSTQRPLRQSPPEAQASPSANCPAQVPAVHSAPLTQPPARVQDVPQLPPAAQAQAPQVVRSGLPAASSTHCPAALHARQGPVQAESQQRPSAHVPDRQLAPSAQASPNGWRARQAPPSRYCPGAHAAQLLAKQESPTDQVMPTQAASAHAPSTQASAGPQSRSGQSSG